MSDHMSDSSDSESDTDQQLPPITSIENRGQLHQYYDITSSPNNNNNHLPPLVPITPLSPPQTPTQPREISAESLQQRKQYAAQNEKIQRLYNPPPEPEKLPKFGPPVIGPSQIDFHPQHDLLGKGQYGTVYKARCRGHPVAVKFPHKQNLSPEELESFKQEVKMMSKNAHPNVISLKGACIEPGKLIIVTELCVTDLESLLNDPKLNPSWHERMKMGRDIAQGMVWLHEITKIVHGDLKPANLLIDKNNHVKITDFGFSQIKSGEEIQDRTTKGSLIWMAPEKMQRKRYTEKSDVFSFGIILWEIAVRKKPYTEFSDPTTFFQAVCYNHVRPPLIPEIPPAVRELIAACWHDNPDVRPTFREIAFRLSSIIVECVVREVHASRYWKEHYNTVEHGLFEYVAWDNFTHDLKWQLGQFDDAYFNELKNLLVENKVEGGRNYLFVSMTRFDTVSKWFPYFFTRERGVTVINEINLLMQQGWFHGSITADAANTALADNSLDPDSFLIRLSSTDPLNHPFTLSMKFNEHKRISRSPTGGFSLDNVVYPNLFDIVARNRHRLKSPAPKSSAIKYAPVKP